MKTPEQVMTETFEANWNLMTTRQLMVAAIEADREQRIRKPLAVIDEPVKRPATTPTRDTRIAALTSSLANPILNTYRELERHNREIAERQGTDLVAMRPEVWAQNLRLPKPGAWLYATSDEQKRAEVILDRLARAKGRIK